MTVDGGAVALMPRWLAATWVWLPALVALVLFGSIAVLGVGSGSSALWWTGSAFACAVTYAGRERWPFAALVVTLLIVAAAQLPGVDVLGASFDVVYLLLLFVPALPLVAVASARPPRSSWLGLAGTVLVTVAASPDPVWSATTSSAEATFVTFVLNVGVPVMIALGAWLAGYTLLTRQRYAEALLDRAVSLERTRDAEAARAVIEERTRIARDLHDVITHSVAVMVVQAAAAEAVWDRDPRQARESLRAVEESGRTVMAELRGMLGAMRADHPAPVERQATPGLDQLSVLVDQIRATGLSARLTASGAIANVAPLTSLSLLRIAQESVTNALRHANATSITIDVAVDEQTVALSVTDDGLGLEATQREADALDPQRLGGHGLVGMHERATVVGGILDVRAGTSCGTVVTVRAPVRQDGLT
jgi:signal transduction histidine kinase